MFTIAKNICFDLFVKIPLLWYRTSTRCTGRPRWTPPSSSMTSSSPTATTISTMPGQHSSLLLLLANRTFATLQLAARFAMISIHIIIIILLSSAVNPDPHWSAFIFPSESGSRRWNLKSKNRKNSKKIGDNCNFFIHVFKVNLPKLHCLKKILLSNLLCFFQLREKVFIR